MSNIDKWVMYGSIKCVAVSIHEQNIVKYILLAYVTQEDMNNQTWHIDLLHLMTV